MSSEPMYSIGPKFRGLNRTEGANFSFQLDGDATRSSATGECKSLLAKIDVRYDAENNGSTTNVEALSGRNLIVEIRHRFHFGWILIK